MMAFCSFFLLFLLLAKMPETHFSTKMGYFGTYGAFQAFLLVQACASSDKLKKGLCRFTYCSNLAGFIYALHN
jgi:hypothetical protein